MSNREGRVTFGDTGEVIIILIDSFTRCFTLIRVMEQHFFLVYRK